MGRFQVLTAMHMQMAVFWVVAVISTRWEDDHEW
jgi:hypothetical protein